MKYFYWLLVLVAFLLVLTTLAEYSVIYEVFGNAFASSGHFVISILLILYAKGRKNTFNGSFPLVVLLITLLISTGISHTLDIINVWISTPNISASRAMILGCISVISTVALGVKFEKLKNAPTINDVTKQYKIANLHRISSLDGILVHEHGVIREANQSASDLLKLPMEELINKAPLAKVVSEEDFMRVQKRIEGGIEGPYKLTVYPADGSGPVYVIVNSSQVTDNGKTLRVTVIKDVTELVNLRSENKRLRENIQDLEAIQRIKQDILDTLISKGGNDGN